MADDFLFPTEKRMEARKANFLTGDSSRTLVQLLLVVFVFAFVFVFVFVFVFASGSVRIRGQVLQKLEKL